VLFVLCGGVVVVMVAPMSQYSWLVIVLLLQTDAQNMTQAVGCGCWSTYIRKLHEVE
jgi:hypothetical protein